MEDIASQSINTTDVPGGDLTYAKFDVGDSITFEATLDLPEISIDGKSDLIIEVFGMDPVGGKEEK